MTDKLLKNMTDRELLVRTVVKTESIERKLEDICKTVWLAREDIDSLKIKEAHREGAENEKDSNTALVIALIAIITSAISMASAVI